MSQLQAGEPNVVALGAKGPLEAGSRYGSVDALRGFIMIVMAIDHASYFIARQHASEFWAGAMSAYTSAFPFLTRWITHLCAPGFFFLMGAGVYWFAASRIEAGLGESGAMRRIIGRGLVLLLLAQLFETPILFLGSLLKPATVPLNRITAPIPNDGSSFSWGLITLTGLGLVLIVCGFLLRLRPWAWLIVSALCVMVTNSLLPGSERPGPLWMSVLLTPGISQHVIVMYPVIPWLGGAAAGMYFGYWWRVNPVQASRRVWIPGAVLVVAGLSLRAAGAWGNIRPPRDNGWIEFLNNVKYPPSLVFWTVSLGIDLLLLALLIRLPEVTRSAKAPWMVFGQTPLFFYLAHLALLGAFGFAFFREPSSLGGAYLMWAVALLLLYPLCLWYRSFKLGKPHDSFWRLL